MILTHGANSIGSGSKIPDEYIELEYLEINRNVGGANFIATFNTFTNTDKEIKLVAEFDAVNDDNQRDLIHISNSSSDSSPGFYLGYAFRTDNTQTIWSSNNGGDYYTPYYDGVITNKLNFSINNSTFDIEKSDGTIINTYTNYAASNYTYLYLFTDRTTPGEWHQFYGKFFELEIQDVAKFVPVKRKSDDVIGLFDLVSQSFITANYGSSNIIAGPVKI